MGLARGPVACMNYQFTMASQTWGGVPQLPEYLLRNCLSSEFHNITYLLWLVIIGSGDGLVLSGNRISLNQWRPMSMMPYGITRPQWVKYCDILSISMLFLRWLMLEVGVAIWAAIFPRCTTFWYLASTLRISTHTALSTAARNCRNTGMGCFEMPNRTRKWKYLKEILVNWIQKAIQKR